MILLRRRNRLGSWLFQYCFARLLARRFGCRLAALPMAGFPGTFAAVPGEEIYGPVGSWSGQWPFEAWTGRRLERAELGQAPGQRLTLDGWFQRFEFIAEAREEIRGDWLRVEGVEAVRPSGDFAIRATMQQPHRVEYRFVDGVRVTDAEVDPAEVAGVHLHSFKLVGGAQKFLRGVAGCRRAHLRCLEEAQAAGRRSLLVIKDDMQFVDGWLERYRAALDELPAGWLQLYLSTGGLAGGASCGI